MTLQPGLLDAARGGRVILFLGAGASRGAAKPGGAQIPGAPELAKRIVSEFLGADYEGASFRSAYDLAASDRSVRELQGFIHQELFEYRPADFHLLLPGFVWAGLATTNYDLIIERAYEQCTAAQQELIPYCKDGDGATDRLGSGRVLYVKLHGCITHYQEINPPLIANTEQIINHREGRAGQFAQFLEWSQTKTIVFAGYGMDDSNLRTLLEEIRREGDNRPRHYIVRPGIRDKEERYWRDRRIEPISLTFEQFLRELDKAIPADRRRLSLLPASFSASPFTRFIARANVAESARLRNYLQSQCEHVSKETTAGAGDPKRFYNGFDLGWYAVAENLDVSRRVTAAVFDEWIISTQAIASTQAVIVEAHAGAGKSVILRRLAWDAAHRLDRLVFFLEHAGAIDIDAIEEIVSLTKQTVYFFIDDVAEAPENILQLLRRGKAQRWPLVLVGGARVNEWNIRCDELEPFVDATYEIGYLSHAEIDDLLGRLERHECLGHLATLPLEERRKQLREIYGRQLLVALHEATKNDSFRNIIHDEFQNIFPREAQILYLDICALHRFGPPVRAGLIARVHGIGFDEFRTRFFNPLEQVVELKWDAKSGDWVYLARHSYIAEILYSEVLASVDEKFDNIMRIVSKLNPGYSYDREVLGEIIRASTLATEFRDHAKGNAIYESVLRSIGREPHILHQRGIYEMRLGQDAVALDRAECFLAEALELAPHNRAIRHSLAELAFARSKISSDELQRESWRRQAEAQAAELARRDQSSYALHTLAKVAIAAVRDSLEKTEHKDDELSQEALSQAIKRAEDVLRSGLQRFPNDAHLLNEEGSLSEILQNADRALRALQRAFDTNPRSELIARRLGRVLRAKGRVQDAIAVVRTALDHNSGSQVLNYDLAQSLREQSPDADTAQGDALIYHFGRSFAPGDKNYEAQFWYGRQLFLAGKGEEAQKIFLRLRQLQLPFTQKRSPRGIVVNQDRTPIVFYGQIYSRKPSFGFIRADQNGLEIYFSVNPNNEIADSLKINQRVTYHLAFTLFGPLAFEVTPLLL